MSAPISLTLRVWRQDGPGVKGRFEDHRLNSVSRHLSLLEALDLVNERLVAGGKRPIAFDHDCREGICGACAMTVNGVPHGGLGRLTVCQIHLHRFSDGDRIVLEPLRARPFALIRDLVVDRSPLDAIQQAGGFISVRPGQAPDANVVPIARDIAETALDLASCIGCGACVAACPNGSAMLFTAAKVGHLNLLPQGAPEADRRALAMVQAMDHAGFGACSNHGECAAVCPKGIGVSAIARLTRAYTGAARRQLLSL